MAMAMEDLTVLSKLLEVVLSKITLVSPTLRDSRLRVQVLMTISTLVREMTSLTVVRGMTPLMEEKEMTPLILVLGMTSLTTIKALMLLMEGQEQIPLSMLTLA